MSGIIFGLFSLSFILLASTTYHMKESAKSAFPAKQKLKKQAAQFGLVSILSFTAAFAFLFIY